MTKLEKYINEEYGVNMMDLDKEELLRIRKEMERIEVDIQQQVLRPIREYHKKMYGGCI